VTRRRVVAALASLAGLIAVGAVLLVSGVLSVGRSQDSRPSCEQLPSRAAVEAALSAHRELVNRLTALGPGVTVNVLTPCAGQPQRALVGVIAGTRAEQDAVRRVLTQETGFGVPAQVLQ